MSDRPSSVLPPDIAEAIRAERIRPSVDLETRARIRSRLRASLAAQGPGAGEPNGGHGVRRPGSSSVVRGLYRAVRRLNPLLAATIGFAVGVAAGVGGHARFTRGETTPANERAALSPSAVTSAPPALERSPSPPVAASAIARDGGDGKRSETSARTEPLSGQSLAAERALLDVARAAFAAGEPDRALTALERHRARYPRGVYREEREALGIQCLAALGRSGEARSKAASFKARYPNSLFLSTVERATGTNP